MPDTGTGEADGYYAAADEDCCTERFCVRPVGHDGECSGAALRRALASLASRWAGR